MSRNGVCEALTTILRERTRWDEAPCLYGMYRDGDGVRLQPVMSEGAWPSGAPGMVLARLAANVSEFRPDVLAALTSPGFIGAAFRVETWGVRQVDGNGGDARARLRKMAATAGRPSLHPDRVEQRFMWAVTRDGSHYVAMQNRGERAILARRPDVQDGAIPCALENLVRAFTAGAN